MPSSNTAVGTAQTPLVALVQSLKDVWRQGTTPDARRAFQEHPELLLHRSLAVDLVYEEYCLLEEVGQLPDLEEFCRKLPAFGSHVREVIRCHRAFADNPGLLAKAERDWPEPGDTFAGLGIVRELGRGAFAHAYLALDPDTGDRPLVLKLSPTPSSEARTLGPISHPNIVAIHWAKQFAGLHAICMPFVGETTLGDAIAAVFHRQPTGPLPTSLTFLSAIESATTPIAHTPPLLVTGASYPDAVAAIAARLADALVYLHRSGLCHGDLKPSNIILAPGGHPYLIDFNLSSGPDNSLVRLGGTLPYMAPERIRLLLGESTLIGSEAATDIYSLGIVLFEALTGRVPFEPAALATPQQAARDLLHYRLDVEKNAAAEMPGVPRSLARLVNRCLLSDPLKRITAEELVKELNRHFRRTVRRSRLLFGGAGLVLTVILAWQLSIGALPAPPARPLTDIATAHSSPSTPEGFFERGVEYLRRGDIAAATRDFGDAQRSKPNGQYIAFLAYCNSLTGIHQGAATLYLDAIEKYGYNTAWVHCNRANSLIQRGSPQDLRLAIEEADAALKIEPDLRAARLNRVYARFLSDLNPRTMTIANPEDCMADLDAIISVGPYSADLYYKMALILTAGAADREDRFTRALAYLHEAVQRGRNPRRFAQEPVFKAHLKGRKDFEQLINLPPIERPEPTSNLHLVDPLKR